MNRRDFLTRLGLGAAAVALSPMLDLAEIIPGPELLAIPADVIEYDQLLAVAQIKWMVNMQVHNPRQMKYLTGITA